MDVAKYLKDKGVQFQELHHPVAFTAQQVAAEQHVPGRMMVKAVVVKVDNKYSLVVLPAIYNVDFQRLKKVLGAKNVSLATEQEMSKLFPDCEVGAEPPFGELYGVPTVVEEHLTSCSEIVFQAGSHTQTMKISYGDFVKLTDAKVGAFGQHI